MGGVKRCLVWRQPAQALLTPHVFAALVHALEALNVAGQPHGRWQAKCSIYQHAAAAAGAARDAYLVSLEGQALAPGYIVLRTEKQVIEAEPAIFEIFDRTGLYRHRMSVGFDGIVYTAGDFVLRLGRVTGPGQARFLGIMLEVEYRPVATHELARLALDDFVGCIGRATASVAGSFEAIEEPRYAEYGLAAPEHAGRHSAVAFVHVISSIFPRRDAAAA